MEFARQANDSIEWSMNLRDSFPKEPTATRETFFINFKLIEWGHLKHFRLLLYRELALNSAASKLEFGPRQADSLVFIFATTIWMESPQLKRGRQASLIWHLLSSLPMSLLLLSELGQRMMRPWHRSLVAEFNDPDRHFGRCCCRRERGSFKLKTFGQLC